MRCAIMQPTYLPWAGYFNLISSVDRFVFLDNVQFDRRSWQSRNRILLNGKEHLLTVPVKKVPRSTTINKIETSVEHASWKEKHLGLIKQAYRKAPFGTEVIGILTPVYEQECTKSLSEINIRLIQQISTAIGLDVKFEVASGLQCYGKRSELLLSICDSIGASEYFSPLGSMEYLKEDRFEEQTATRLLFQSYVPMPYTQHTAKEFISHLSIIDVLAELGSLQTAAYIR